MFIHSHLQQLIYYSWKLDNKVLLGQPAAEIKAYKRARITWCESSEADTHAIVKCTDYYLYSFSVHVAITHFNKPTHAQLKLHYLTQFSKTLEMFVSRVTLHVSVTKNRTSSGRAHTTT
jgi:hypothetical protein